MSLNTKKCQGITEDDLAWSDVTTSNVSTVQHGLVPKAPNDANQFLNGLGAWATVSASSLGLVIGTNVQAYAANLTLWAAVVPASYLTTSAATSTYVVQSITVNGHALSSNVTVTKSDLSLGSVENTALSTWAGTSSITTLGTIGTGTWNATVIALAYGGNGIVAAPALLTNKSAAQSSVATYTPAADGTFLVHMFGSITNSGGGGSVTCVVNYTDEAGTGRAATLFRQGTTTAGLTSGAFNMPPVAIRAKGTNAITATTTLSGSVTAYNVGAVIQQLA